MSPYNFSKMKLKYLFITLLAFAGLGLASWAGDNELTDAKAEYMAPAAPGGYYSYSFTLDTITDAELDTLTMPVNLLSDWVYNYRLIRTNISGTSKITAYLQASSSTSGNTDWITIDSIGASNSGAVPARMVGDHTYGVRHRIILDGGGTHSTSYNLDVWLKRRN